MRAASGALSRADCASAASPCTRSWRCAGECGTACRIARVEHRAVRQHDAHAGQRVVAVLRRAAAHAAGVVGGDAADHRGVDRGRIGSDLAAVARQAAIGFGADHAGLQRDGGRVGADLAAAPAVAEQHQHRIGDRLARQAGARGAERHRRAEPGAFGEQPDHLLFAFDHDERAWGSRR